MKIIFNPKIDTKIEGLSKSDQNTAYDRIKYTREQNAKRGCNICPICGISRFTNFDTMGDCEENIKTYEEVVKSIEINRKIFFGLITRTKKIPVKWKCVYKCKMCGSIYESEEWSMEDIPYPNR